MLDAVNITAKIMLNVVKFLLINAIYHLIIFIILYRAVYYTVFFYLFIFFYLRNANLRSTPKGSNK